MAAPSASMGERWDFLTPWCAILKGHIEFDALACSEHYVDTWKNHLKVTLPTRKDVKEDENSRNTNNSDISEEEKLQQKFQKTREALAVLAAVAHVDNEGWKDLLVNFCGVDLGGPGEEEREKNLPAKFLLFMDREGDHIKEEKCDLVTFCGVHQRTQCSVEYLHTLKKISALADTLTPENSGADVEIPVKLHASSCLNESGPRLVAAMKEIAKEEKMAKEEWELCNKSGGKEGVAWGSIRCTFVLEPMIVDFSGCLIDADTAEAMEKLVRDNVWASEVSVRLTMDPVLSKQQRQAKVAFCRLVTSLFDSTRRPYAEANSQYSGGLDTLKQMPLQFGMVHLHCDVRLEQLDMASLFSAIAVTQTTRNFSIRVDSKIYSGDAGVDFWKWIAYAFFSDRAASHSSVESLTVTDVGLISPAEMEGFTAVMTSKHPVEELFGCQPGRVAGKEGTLNAHAPIKWSSDPQAHPTTDSQPLSFDVPIPFVRTFSDNGRSKWVNVLVPGLGRCQVQRSDLVVPPGRKKRAISIPSNVTSFTIRYHGFMMWVRTDNLHLILKVMGSQLKYLKIVCPSDSMDVDDVVQGCPNLDKMEIWRGYVNVGFDFTEHHKSRKALSAPNFNGWNNNELAEILSDSSDPVITSVRRLLVRRLSPPAFGMVVYDSRIKTEIKKYLKMLEENRTLEHLEMHLSTPFHKYLSAFREHHLEPIDGSIKLPNESKMAFLSVVNSPSEMPVKAAKKDDCETSVRAIHPMRQLSRGVIWEIFSFARSPVLRKVYAVLVNDGVPLGISDEEDLSDS